MSNLKIVVIFILLFLCSKSYGQDSLSTIYIDTVQVNYLKSHYESIGTTVYKLPAQKDGGRHFSIHSPLIIKSYSPGLLTTASARGTSANHLGVNWNGVNIQSITHGQVDLGLLETPDNAIYIPGGNSPMDGSGSLGGLISLNTSFQRRKGKQFYLGAALASFGNKGFYGGFDYTANKFSTQSFLNYKNGQNNFSFINTASVQKNLVKQTNSAFHTLQFRQSFQYMLSKKHLFKLHYWLTNANRQIPPTMTGANDHALQLDNAHRLIGEWLYSINSSTSLRTKLANINDQLIFSNDGLYSFTATSTQVFDSRLSKKVKKHALNLGVFSRYEKANSDGYSTKHQRFTTAISLADIYSPIKNINLSIQGRLESPNGEKITPIFSLASEWEIAKKRDDFSLKLKGKFGRHFHAPTFNDLFWIGLGVSDLKSEIGYQSEMSLSAIQSNKNSTLNYSLTGFWLDVNNWILWAPNEFGVWRPSNKKKVQSTGIESQISYQYTKSDYKLGLSINYTFVKSVNKKGSQNIDKQLLYVPKHKADAYMSFRYKRWALISEQNFVAKRPYTTDNTKYVPAYFIQNLQLGYKFKLKSHKLGIHARLNNLTDLQYQIIKFRPMPGRSFEVGISFGSF